MSDDAPTTMNILDGFISRCSIDRVSQLPTDATVTLNLSARLLDAPSNKTEVTLTVMVTPRDAAEGTVNASVSFVFTLAEVLIVLPGTLVGPLLQMAWPYLRSALDTIGGLARVPSLALPLAPPIFTVDIPSSETTNDTE